MFGLFKKEESEENTQSRLSKIKAMGNAEDNTKKKKKKGDGSDVDTNFYKLIDYLDDEAPECRIAAAEILGKSGRDVAFTHISHHYDIEKDENVKKALKEALVNLRGHSRQ